MEEKALYVTERPPNAEEQIDTWVRGIRPIVTKQMIYWIKEQFPWLDDAEAARAVLSLMHGAR
jgi:hypothetical protein